MRTCLWLALLAARAGIGVVAHQPSFDFRWPADSWVSRTWEEQIENGCNFSRSVAHYVRVSPTAANAGVTGQPDGFDIDAADKQQRFSFAVDRCTGETTLGDRDGLPPVFGVFVPAEHAAACATIHARYVTFDETGAHRQSHPFNKGVDGWNAMLAPLADDWNPSPTDPMFHGDIHSFDQWEQAKPQLHASLEHLPSWDRDNLIDHVLSPKYAPMTYMLEPFTQTSLFHCATSYGVLDATTDADAGGAVHVNAAVPFVVVSGWREEMCWRPWCGNKARYLAQTWQDIELSKYILLLPATMRFALDIVLLGIVIAATPCCLQCCKQNEADRQSWLDFFHFYLPSLVFNELLLSLLAGLVTLRLAQRRIPDDWQRTYSGVTGHVYHALAMTDHQTTYWHQTFTAWVVVVLIFAFHIYILISFSKALEECAASCYQCCNGKPRPKIYHFQALRDRNDGMFVKERNIQCEWCVVGWRITAIALAILVAATIDSSLWQPLTEVTLILILAYRTELPPDPLDKLNPNKFPVVAPLQPLPAAQNNPRPLCQPPPQAPAPAPAPSPAQRKPSMFALQQPLRARKFH